MWGNRVGALLLVLLAMPVVFAQPSLAQVTLNDLQGARISGSINLTGRVHYLKYNVEQPAEYIWNFNLDIGPGSAIKGNIVANGSSGGKSSSRTRTFSGIIGQASVGGDGPKAVLWTLQGGTLTSLRVLGTGAAVVKIAVTRSGSGLKCAASGLNAREVGAGDTKTTSPSGEHVEVLHMRQTSSSCQVTKQ